MLAWRVCMSSIILPHPSPIFAETVHRFRPEKMLSWVNLCDWLNTKLVQGASATRTRERSPIQVLTCKYMKHFLLSHMAVHQLHHLHYHHLHLLLLAEYFILNSRLGSSANHFLHGPFPFLPDWLHGLSDHLTIFVCSTTEFVCMVC